MLHIYVKHYLTEIGVNYFKNYWFQKVLSNLKQQKGFISFDYALQDKVSDCVDITLRFEDSLTFDVWCQHPNHDRLIHALHPYRSRDYFEAKCSEVDLADPSTLEWEKETICPSLCTKRWTEYSCILKPSAIEGIGVHCTHDIEEGTEVFAERHPTKQMKIAEVPPQFIKYCVFINNEECIAPERFDRMSVGFYLNHSDTPNIVRIAPSLVIAIRDIKAGEELLLDYNQLDEPSRLKEPYYAPME